MKKLTDAWNEAVAQYRYSKWNVCGPREPIMPWIPPTTPVCLARALKNIGTVITLEPDEEIAPTMRGLEPGTSEYVQADHLIYVNKGIIARTHTKAKAADAKLDFLSITPAGRILGGGLDYFFCHPFSSYHYALTKSEIVVCSKKMLNQILAGDAAMNETLRQHFELCHLSSSITLEAISSLPVIERIKLYLLSWAVYWGVLMIDDDGGKWIRIPLPLLREDFSRLISASKTSVDKVFVMWQKEGRVHTNSPHLFFQADLVKEELPWLCVFDEYRSDYRNDLDFEDIMPVRALATGL